MLSEPNAINEAKVMTVMEMQTINLCGYLC